MANRYIPLKLCVSTVLLIAAGRVHAQSSHPITWTACPADIVNDYPEIAERLDCGILRVPLDHRHGESGWIDVEITRVHAEKPLARQGTLFVNFGGPGIPARSNLPMIATLWFLTDPTSSGTAQAIRELSRSFDLIGVTPRGMQTRDGLRCTSSETLPVYANITDQRDEANLERVEQHATVIARGCQAQTGSAYINSEQTAYDMDAVRQALGETRIHYFGISYGTWLGAWYGAMFPDHVDRMLLDSNMDWTSTFDAAALAKAPAMQTTFFRDVAQTAAADPGKYGMGSDAKIIAASFASLSPRVRSAMRTYMMEPSTLMLARFVDDVLLATPQIGQDELAAVVQAHSFSTDEDVQARVQFWASYTLPALFEPGRPELPLDMTQRESMHYTVSCNDTASIQDPAYWRGIGNTYAQRFPVGGSSASMNPCTYWSGPTATLPPIQDNLPRVPSVLMLQSEFDAATPLKGALNAFSSVPGLHMVIAKGESMHGLFGHEISPCADRAAARYLAYGELPEQPLSECRSQPPSTRAAHTTRYAELLHRWAAVQQ